MLYYDETFKLWDGETPIKLLPIFQTGGGGGGSGLPTLTLNSIQELNDYIDTFSNKQLALNEPYKGNGTYMYITQKDIDVKQLIKTRYGN